MIVAVVGCSASGPGLENDSLAVPRAGETPSQAAARARAARTRPSPKQREVPRAPDVPEEVVKAIEEIQTSRIAIQPTPEEMKQMAEAERQRQLRIENEEKEAYGRILTEDERAEVQRYGKLLTDEERIQAAEDEKKAAEEAAKAEAEAAAAEAKQAAEEAAAAQREAELREARRQGKLEQPETRLEYLQGLQVLPEGE